MAMNLLFFIPALPVGLPVPLVLKAYVQGDSAPFLLPSPSTYHMNSCTYLKKKVKKKMLAELAKRYNSLRVIIQSHPYPKCGYLPFYW